MGRRWVTAGVATLGASLAIAAILWLVRSRDTGHGIPAPRTIDLSAVDLVLQDLARSCNALSESAHPTLSLRPARAALARLDVQSESGSHSPGLLLNVARELAKAGDLERALDLIDRAAVQTPANALNNAVVHFARATVHLRSAGLGNCNADADPGGCLMGQASNDLEREHAEAAVRSLEVVLVLRPDDPAARWLINMAHARMGSYPEGVPARWLIPAQAFGVADAAPTFTDVARDVGVAAVNMLGGSIMDDFDNDGFLDVFTTSYGPCTSAMFYRNNGDGSFTDGSDDAGLTYQLGGFNAVQTDYDNDGYLDVFILRGAWQFAYGRKRNSLLRNNGDGTFVDVTRTAGLAEPAYPTQAGAWADFDNDGDLDLYVGNEAEDQQVHYPNQLFRNNGDGTFTDVASQAGVTNDGMTKGVAWGDYDNDGDPDLYVSNIGPNSLYRNNGDGTFTDVYAMAITPSRTIASTVVERTDSWSFIFPLFQRPADPRQALHQRGKARANHHLLERDPAQSLGRLGQQANPMLLGRKGLDDSNPRDALFDNGRDVGHASRKQPRNREQLRAHLHPREVHAGDRNQGDQRQRRADRQHDCK